MRVLRVRNTLVNRTCSLLFAVIVFVGCQRTEAPRTADTPKPSILLVTLDTTRADAIGPDTPSFNALAQRGTRFRWAYAAVPQTLPSP